MLKLFDNEASDSDVEIKTNNDYATHYNRWREKEELNKLKNKYGEHATLNLEGSEDDSSSSEDDEDGKHLTDEFEKDFFKTLAYLKRKDPKIYDEKVVFFEKKLGENESSHETKNKAKKHEPMFMKDFERKMILEKGAKFEDSDEEELEEDPRSRSPTYVEEQKRIKESLKKAVEDEEHDNDKWGGLFHKRQKTKEEQEKEEEDYKKWLKGNQEHLENKEMESELQSLKEYWNKPDLDKSEVFLRDYLLNKRYLDKDDENHIPTYEEIIHDSDDDLSEDEKNIEKQEEFEQKYNFRYEEPDQEFIKRYPRTMDHSVRKTDDRRKLKREEIKQRKEQEKKQKQEDLKQLKILKRREIEEKIQKIKEITGNEQLAFQETDIDGEFDPEEHDRRMQELFNDQYYEGEEGDQKPEYSNFEDELGPWKDRNELNCDDENFNMDCDYDPSTSKQEKNKKEKKKRNRPGKSSKSTNEDEEIPLDENDDRYGEYMDELYKLDYEDMIGDIPCRFKYRDVVPNDFGLSVEEILVAKDKELNRWSSLKKATQYRPEEAERYDVIAYKKKAENEGLKKKYLPSLYEELEEEINENQQKNSETEFNNVQENTEAGEGKYIKKSKKKKQNQEQNSEIKFNDAQENTEAEEVKDIKKSKKKKQNQEKNSETEFNDAQENTEAEEVKNIKKSKKKKQNQEKNSETEFNDAQENTEAEEVKDIKKSKKKKQNQEKNSETEFNDAQENTEAEEIKDIKKFKKKKQNQEKNSKTEFNIAQENTEAEEAKDIKKYKNKKLEAPEETIEAEKFNTSKKSKKNKNNKEQNKEIEVNKKTEDEQNYENENLENSSADKFELSKKSKKRKYSHFEENQNNMNESSEIRNRDITENADGKKSKKRKQNNSVSENQIPEPKVSVEHKKLTRRQKKNKKIVTAKLLKITNNDLKENISRKRKLSGEQSDNNNPKKKQKINNKNKKFISKNKVEKKTNISDSRLEAYGINPKKFKNKLKYKN